MSLFDRIWISLVSVPVVWLERGLAYFAVAGLAWVGLHLLLGRRLSHRRTGRTVPTIGQMEVEVLRSIRSLAVYGVFGGAMVFAVLSGWTPMYFRIDRWGWTWFATSVALSVLVHDAYFYWTHRLMHHPRLFRLLHRTHHLSTSPSPWAAYSFGFSEAVVQAGIAPLLIFTIPMHPLAFSTFMLWQISYNVAGHCGYELYPRWFVRSWCGHIFNTTTHHAQHHEFYRANYGLYFNIWDWLMGTNNHRYAERYDEVTGNVATERPAAAQTLLARSSASE